MLDEALLGRLTGSPEGVMKDDVSMKKINSRKIMSVIDDMLNAISTLFLDFNAMIWLSVLNLKLDAGIKTQKVKDFNYPLFLKFASV